MNDAVLRRARAGDAAELVRLSAELGYPADAQRMASRLAVLLADDRHLVAVAAGGDSLCGWVHAEHRCSLETGERTELVGLVVDSRRRRHGLGRELVAVAEAWSAARGAPYITVRSNVARAESHPFYEGLGYARSKTQHAYKKSLDAFARDAAVAIVAALDAESAS